MTTMPNKTRGSMVVGPLCVGCWPIAAYTQNVLWDGYNDAGADAYRQGRYADAQNSLVATLQEAETFGTPGPRLAMTLNNLGGRESFGGFGFASGAGE